MKNKIIIALLGIVLIVVIFFGIKREKIMNNQSAENSSNSNNQSTTQGENIDNQSNETDDSIVDKYKEIDKVKIDDEKGSYFIQTCEKPLYKISEKELKIPVLIYHDFQTPIPYEKDTYKLCSSRENFEENVKTLLDEGYTFITLEDIYLYKMGKIGLPEKNITITADDGYVGCYTDMFPVLEKYNVPATIFVINGYMGSEYYFSWEKAKEMYNTGLVKIHPHGYYHDDATNYTIEKLKKIYNESHDEIVENLEDESIYKIMAYPSGKSNEKTINALKEEGFLVQVQTRYGTVNNSYLDLTNIGRVRAERATGRQILNAIK